MSSLIQTFRAFPKELFRVNNGRHIRIRPRPPGRSVFDISVDNGLVKAKALDPSTYKAPNGASIRPNSPYQHHLVKRLFRGHDVIVYSVPAGTQLPESLILVHERSDHYSLQPAHDMTVEDLNNAATRFFLSNAKLYTRDEWIHAYPRPTEMISGKT